MSKISSILQLTGQRLIPTPLLVTGCGGRQADSNPNQPSEEQNAAWLENDHGRHGAETEVYSWEHSNIFNNDFSTIFRCHGSLPEVVPKRIWGSKQKEIDIDTKKD